jgi:hypothetical protein
MYPASVGNVHIKKGVKPFSTPQEWLPRKQVDMMLNCRFEMQRSCLETLSRELAQARVRMNDSHQANVLPTPHNLKEPPARKSARGKFDPQSRETPRSSCCSARMHFPVASSRSSRPPRWSLVPLNQQSCMYAIEIHDVKLQHCYLIRFVSRGNRGFTVARRSARRTLKLTRMQ